MANFVKYSGPSPYSGDSYSLLDDDQFKTAFSQNGQPQQQEAGPSQDPMIDQSTALAAAKGMQSGGLSGALTAGGVSSLLTNGAAAGGPYAIAGGLLLSELQAAQEAKAKQEAEMIANEKNRRTNVQNLLQQNSRTAFRV